MIEGFREDRFQIEWIEGRFIGLGSNRCLDYLISTASAATLFDLARRCLTLL